MMNEKQKHVRNKTWYFAGTHFQRFVTSTLAWTLTRARGAGIATGGCGALGRGGEWNHRRRRVFRGPVMNDDKVL